MCAYVLLYTAQHCCEKFGEVNFSDDSAVTCYVSHLLNEETKQRGNWNNCISEFKKFDRSPQLLVTIAAITEFFLFPLGTWSICSKFFEHNLRKQAYIQEVATFIPFLFDHVIVLRIFIFLQSIIAGTGRVVS